MATSKSTDADLWLSAAALGRLTGWSLPEIRNLREQFSRGQTKGSGNQLKVYGPALFRGLHASWKEARHGRNADATAAHARLKNAQAEKAELELAKAKREVVSVEEMNDVFGSLGDALRNASERLLRCCGPEAAFILQDATEQSFHEFKQRYDD